MPDKLRPVLWAIVALLALYLWGNCRESAGASKQRLRDSTIAWNTHSHATDLRVSRLAAESLELGARLMRLQRNDSVARREIVRLRARIRPVDSIPRSSPPDTFVAQLQLRDSVIALQGATIASQDSSLTIWRALAVERGELLQRALQERDGYRSIARAWEEKANHRLGCAGGPTVVATLSGHVSAGVGVTCGIRF